MIILHRQNEIEQTVDKTEDGIEIDIRSSNKGLVLNHDLLEINSEYPLLEDELIFFDNSKILIANVKESGLEEKLMKVFDKKNIDYYFLDSQIPDIIRISKSNCCVKNRFIIRVSDMEVYNKDLINLVQPDYIWFDWSKFNIFDIDDYMYSLSSLISNIENSKIKIILVSPELYSKDYEELADIIIRNIEILLKEDIINKLNVCTKTPNKWRLLC